MFRADVHPMPDIVTILSASTRFRTWTTVLVRTLFVDDLRKRGPWSILAPTDEAFELLPSGVLERLFRPSAIEALIDLAEHHILRSTEPPDGQLLSHKFAANGVRGGRVLARRTCSNGHLCVVDRVAIPAGLLSRVMPPVRAA